jgi:release factor glutamine methyltransferase
MRELENGTTLDLLRWGTQLLQSYDVPTPRLDAEVLLAHLLQTTRVDLYLRSDRGIDKLRGDQYRDLTRRRALDRVPLAYLTGEREFFSQPLRVGRGALIPRPESEVVVEAVVELGPERVIDVGTGCGAIACAVALQLPGAEVLAIDRSRAALHLAQENVERLGLRNRVMLIAGDLLSGVDIRVDVIAANLPYVPTPMLALLEPEVRHEPEAALDGGKDGLGVIRRLIQQAPARLSRSGALVLEVGEGHAGPVAELLDARGAGAVEVRKDLAGVERVLIGRFGES